MRVDIVLLSYHLDSPFNSHQIIYPIQTTENCSKRGRGYQLVERGYWQWCSGCICRGQRTWSVGKDCLPWNPLHNQLFTSLITPLRLSYHILQDIHELSGGDSSVFAVVSWHDSVQGLAVSRRDEMLSPEVCSYTWVLWFHLLLSLTCPFLHSIIEELRGSGGWCHQWWSRKWKRRVGTSRVSKVEFDSEGSQQRSYGRY